MPGPDLPPPHEPLTVEHYRWRWPTCAEKVELWDGELVFQGEFDERDAEMARLAYPGRVIELDEGLLWVKPAPVP